MQGFDPKLIEKFLKRKDVCIVCIGNPLRGDDAVGLEIGREIEKFYDKVIVCELDPTAYVEKMKKYKNILIIDGIKMNKEPGSVWILKKEDILDLPFTTHDIGLRFIVEKFLKEREVLILGICIEKTDFGRELSDKVKKAKELVVLTIRRILGGKHIPK